LPTPTEGRPALTVHRNRRSLINLSVVVAITGIQLVVPALPALQRDLGLSNAEVSLVSSAYLLPSVPAAFLSGMIAQRLGRRRVFVAALSLFGIAGLLVPVVGGASLPILLAARFVQGIGFAGILPTTITLIGDLFSGPTQVTVQGQRSLSMQIGDALLPVLGGFLTLGSWRYPFFAPALALPLAVWASKVFPPELDQMHPEASARSTGRAVAGYVRNPALLALEYAGFLRFLVKFVVLTYLPVLAVTNRGMPEYVAGIALGAAAAAGGIGAVLVGRLVRMVRFSRVLAFSLIILAAGVWGLAGAHSAVPLVVGAVAFGVGDGLFGVLQNSIVAVAVGGPERATFVSFTGAVRNAGKFLAPVLAAGLTLIFPVSMSFIAMGGVAAASLLIVRPLRRFERMFDPTDSTA
jgi:ACDE family multidrug resistance protein